MRLLSYCNELKDIDSNEQEFMFYKEHVSRRGDENPYKIQYGFKKCLQALPFNASTLTCRNCNRFHSAIVCRTQSVARKNNAGK